LLDQVLTAFNVEPDFDLNAMQPGQSLSALTGRLMADLAPVFEQVKPAMVVVQGDTTTTFCGALSAFYLKVPVAHIEAGLRTGDRWAPFPEEINRVLTSRLASLHFAPTDQAARNLEHEGVSPDHIHVSGNTGIDSVLSIGEQLKNGRLPGLQLPLDSSKRTIVVTAHRRETFGAALEAICDAMSDLANRPDVQIVWPVHPNPNVQSVIRRRLAARPNVLLTKPLEYVPFVDLMRRAYLLITDSGGIQEEAPSLGKPVLVLRDKTERPEAIEVGVARLAGTNRSTILNETVRLLEDRAAYDAMARVHNPYGDGRASSRIASQLSKYLAS
jgi:UDP-N-acetylglucosamine 2-epimerase (non-hydrolysing)